MIGQDVNAHQVGMRFGDYWAIQDINVHIQAGEFFSFLGPSGCGKTTLLRLISGFMDPSQGQITIGGKDMRGIGPNKRQTAMIFQNLALFPLMTVADNIAFGLEARGIGKSVRLKKAAELLEMVDMPGWGDKRVQDLSGGQKQRVAIARALAVEPSVLLLDEPLSALDLKLRKHMRAELRGIQRRTGVTFIYITHDQGEALTMSDRVGVMSVGKLEQVDAPDTIYNHPASGFVASFVGENNALVGKVSRVNGQHAWLDTPSGTFRCRKLAEMVPGQEATAFVRPETLCLVPSPNGQENLLHCTATAHSFEGAYSNLRLLTQGGQKLVLRLPNQGQQNQFAPDTPVAVTFAADHALLLQ